MISGIITVLKMTQIVFVTWILNESLSLFTQWRVTWGVGGGGGVVPANSD